MTEIIVSITRKNNKNEDLNVLEIINNANISEEFEIIYADFSVRAYSKEILEFVVEKGFSSIFNYSISLEDITSPSMTINQIENVIARFLGKLKGARKLLITDPYFYAKSNKIDVCQIFINLLSPLANDLEEIYFITNGKTMDIQKKIHSGIKILNKKINIYEAVSDEFHDRFWIDPENLKGLVMGTSLNGIGNKIALVDHLHRKDVEEVTDLARPIIKANYPTSNF